MWRTLAPMSETFAVACRDCRVYLDVAQKNNVTGRPYFWADDSLESMTHDFIIDHGTHSIGFLPSEWLDANDYGVVNDDD
jgi:hypothetical protein